MFDLDKPEFSQKEKILLLLKEYDALRAEITSMATGHNQFIALMAAVISAALTVGFAQIDFSKGFSDPKVLPLVLLVAALILALDSRETDHQQNRLASAYLASIHSRGLLDTSIRLI